MSRNRYYITCPDCYTRMVRTGKNLVEKIGMNDEKIYSREYYCSNCGLIISYSESRNMIMR